MWVPKSKTLKKHRKCKHNSCKWCIDIDSLIDQRRSLLWEKKCSSEIDSLLIELKTVTKIRWFAKMKFQLNVCWLITRMFIYNKQEITKRFLFPFIALDRMYSIVHCLRYQTFKSVSMFSTKRHKNHRSSFFFTVWNWLTIGKGMKRTRFTELTIGGESTLLTNEARNTRKSIILDKNFF